MPGPRTPRRHVKFDRPANEKPDAPKKPRFENSERPKSGSKLWVVLGLLAVVGVGAYGAKNFLERPDRHYVIASNLVHEYETGRKPTERNYNNTIYQKALDELDLVNPKSISAVPAEELRDDILHGRAAFLARRESKTPAATIASKRQERIERNVQSHKRALANIQTEYPECDDEEKGAHKH